MNFFFISIFCGIKKEHDVGERSGGEMGARDGQGKITPRYDWVIFVTWI